MKPFILLSYYYARKNILQMVLDLALANKIELLIDCGAFSFLSTGAKIDVDEYCSFCSDLPKGITYISLDEPYNSKVTQKNYEYMVNKKNLSPMPVWVHGDTILNLIQLLKTNNWIAVGGGDLRLSRTATYQYLKWVFEESGGADKIHVFGKVLIELFKFYHTKSFDNASVQQASVYSKMWYDGKLYSIKTTNRTSLIRMANSVQFDIRKIKSMTTIDSGWQELSLLSALRYSETLYQNYKIKYFCALTKPALVKCLQEVL